MNLHEAETLARRLMSEYGVTQMGWRFCWDKRPLRRLGHTRYRQKEIGLSVTPTQYGTKAEVEDTIRHEIAHALVGPGYGHDEVWQRMARHVGATPKASTMTQNHSVMAKQAAKYTATCGCPGQVHGIQRMTESQRLYGSRCKRCGAKLQFRQQY
jgi:predicted SprT family Zn-dependent metalloprotease